MKQDDLGLNLTSCKTRTGKFLDEMERVVQWAQLLAQIEPHAPRKERGRPLFDAEVMLCIHFLPQWFGLSDLAVEGALFNVPLYRQFAGLSGMNRLPDRVSILRFRQLLDQHELAPKTLKVVNATLAGKGLMLKESTAVDASLIASPRSTKNNSGTRGLEMHPTRKGNQWYFGMKCHIGVDGDSGLVHTVVGASASINDVTQVHALVHGAEAGEFADAGCQGVGKRDNNQDTHARWHIALRPGPHRLLGTTDRKEAIADQMEHVKARIRAKAEHPFRVIKRQFDHVKVRYRGRAKNTVPLHTLFAQSNLWMARRQLMAAQG